MTEKRVVVHLTTAHPWDDIRIFHKECRTLAAAGYRVVLVAPDAPTGTQDGVECIGIPRETSRIRRVLLNPIRAWRATRGLAPSLYHLHDPELLPLGFLLAVTGHRVIFDAHEHLSAQVRSKAYLWRWVRPVIAAGATMLEWISGHLLDSIVAATPAIAGIYPAGRTCLVQNFPFRDELVISGGMAYPDRPMQAAYVGGLSAVRGAVEMVQAAGLVAGRQSFSLIMAGRFAPGLEERCSRLPGWTHVTALGWQSRDKVAELLGRSRMGLVLFHPVPNHLEAQPNKLFEYMSAGLPIVASRFPLWQDMVEKFACGVVADPLDPAAVATAISWILDHPGEARAMGDNGRRAVLERFNWEVESASLVQWYRTRLTDKAEGTG